MNNKNPIYNDNPDWNDILLFARTISKRSSNLTASFGNASVLFSIFVLESKLLSLLDNPTASINDILLITDSIALLNDTLKLYNTSLNST